MFAGVRALNANRVALAQAEELERAGKASAAVWTATGWFKTPDGGWRWEIDDSAAELLGKPARMLAHSRLLEAYPELAELRVEIGHATARFGRTWFGDTLSDCRIEIEAPDLATGLRVTLHELQHVIQAIEGWEPGGSLLNGAAYPYLAGEAEARAVQARASLSPQGRRSTFPLDSYDVPLEQIMLSHVRVVLQ